MSLAIEIAERRLAPDFVLRATMRRMMQRRLRAEASSDRNDWIAALGAGPIAEQTDAANEQHYEVPAEFFRLCLGPHLKYSCGFWPDAATTLADSEAAMLALSAERAALADGQQVLELGCGWGSLSLWMAEHYPASTITSVSNSASQRAFIEQRARDRGLRNLEVITADMRDFAIDRQFDRVVSIEMFEHMRNYRLLLERVASWLRADGRAFVHIFCHREYSYPFENENGNDWMTQHFFSGGIMPNYDIFAHFTDHLTVEQQWQVNGKHYERTSNAWLAELDRNRAAATQALAAAVPGHEIQRMLQRWRMFYMACAELFGTNGGKDWFVGHYRLKKTPA
ncbi:MAG: cyclopropane-fatty-acyl-phospholipid synthase family protein [Pseudomonadota bacterium]